MNGPHSKFEAEQKLTGCNLGDDDERYHRNIDHHQSVEVIELFLGRKSLKSSRTLV